LHHYYRHLLLYGVPVTHKLLLSLANTCDDFSYYAAFYYGYICSLFIEAKNVTGCQLSEVRCNNNKNQKYEDIKSFKMVEEFQEWCFVSDITEEIQGVWQNFYQ
jgi:hypothetical protein